MEKKNQKETIQEKEEAVSFFDRRSFNWFIDTKTNELKIGKSLADFLSNETEKFSFKKIHSGDIKYWNLAETTDGKFVLLSRPKMMK
jgi:hypothetical protein